MDSTRVQQTARAWADAAHPERQAAVAAVTATGAFSAAQVAFALNEQMQALSGFVYSVNARTRRAVVQVVSEDVQPLCGLAESLALTASGWDVHLPPEARYLLTRTFLRACGVPTADVASSVERTFHGYDSDASRWSAYPLSIAVLDGKENSDAREDLSEDVLLYNGASARCVRILFAPHGTSPDLYLRTFAEWRGRWPAPERLRAAVRMMSAFARKAGFPLAELDDHSLLLTRGVPEPQRPGHVRWVTYAHTDEVVAFCSQYACRVFSRRGFHPVGEGLRLGQAHRPGSARFDAALQAVTTWEQLQAG